MSPLSPLDRLVSWLAYLPIRFAYRIVWLAARLDLGEARAVYAAMWDANLNLPVLRDRDGAEGGDANAAPVPQDRQARVCAADIAQKEVKQ